MACHEVLLTGLKTSIPLTMLSWLGTDWYNWCSQADRRILQKPEEVLWMAGDFDLVAELAYLVNDRHRCLFH